MLPPPMLPTTSTSFTSVRLNLRELLFTLVLPPHPPSEAHRELELPSMDTHLSMDMAMLTPPMDTSWESVRLSPKVLLFTLVLPPHPPSEAHRVQELPSMDIPLSMDMVMDTLPMDMVSMATTDTSK